MLQLLRSFGISLFFWPILSFASFDLSPIIVTVTPGGPGATTSLTITNSDDTKTPVQVAIYKRDPDADGKEKYAENKDIGDMFQIFPSQMILNPKEKRTVRVTYVGDPKLKTELAFRVIAEEFPINVTDPEKVKNRAVASIAIATKYIGSLYVTPQGTKPEIHAEAAAVVGKSGQDMVLTIQNKGTQHFVLKSPKFKAVLNNKEYEFPQESANKIGSQNILAGKFRKFTLPWPKGIPVGPAKVLVEVAKQ